MNGVDGITASAGSVKFSWVITTEKGESNFKRNLEGELVNAGFADVIVVNGGYKAVSVIAPVGPIIELFEKSKDFERVGGVGAAHNHGYEVGYNSIRLPNVIHEATLFETPSAASNVKYLQKPEQLRSCIKDYIKEQRQKRQYCERD